MTAISVLLTVGSGYWMAYRIVNTETVEVKTDAEKGENKTMEIPDDGKVSFSSVIIRFLYLVCFQFLYDFGMLLLGYDVFCLV